MGSNFLIFLNSLSYASSGDEELVELTANFDDDDDDDDCEEEWRTEMIDKEMFEERRRQKENCVLYEVTKCPVGRVSTVSPRPLLQPW